MYSNTMPEDFDFDEALQVDVLANALRMGKAEAGDLMESLSSRLQMILPDSTSIERAGWFLSSSRPVRLLTVKFDECNLQLEREKSGMITPRLMKVVRGVVLKTTTINLDDWMKTLAAELNKSAQHNSNTLEALKKFVIG